MSIMPCKRCGEATDKLATQLCDNCWELERRIKYNPKVALEILDDLGELPVPLPILQLGAETMLTEPERVDREIGFYSMLLPEGEVTLSLPVVKLPPTSYELFNEWWKLVGKAIIHRQEGLPDEVSG